ncbi:hypothetical protein LNP26_09025 [Klebsiella variicola subsp. variicola]|nr:hypothetical protein [Klebsiella variicola subsp. variicola]
MHSDGAIAQTRPLNNWSKTDEKVVTVCPYCASGCKINLVVDNGKIVRAEAAQGKTNQGTLCLKGYYGWDFINDTQILTPRLKTPHDPSSTRRQAGSCLLG